jgi:hypothetical protein
MFEDHVKPSNDIWNFNSWALNFHNKIPVSKKASSGNTSLALKIPHQSPPLSTVQIPGEFWVL